MMRLGIPRWLQPAPDSLWRKSQRGNRKAHLELFNVLWSLWVFAAPLFSEVGAGFWWSLAIGYPLFLVLFVLVYVRPAREVLLHAGAMGALAFVSMLWNPAGWTYAVFACVYAGIASVPHPWLGIARIAAIQAVVLVLAWFLGWPWFVMALAMGVCTSASMGAMFGYMSLLRDVESRQSDEEIRRLAATSERERIGRDLHDLLGHTLSLITLKLELSRKLFDRDHDAARRELEDAERVARKALAEVRAAVTGIRATDLAAEVASARLLLESSGVAFRYEPPARELPVAVERVLALVVREAVTNIARHAGATSASIEFSGDAAEAHLCIADNGRGGITRRGNGLTGVRERVGSLHGQMTLDSPRGKGTRLDIRIPLAGIGEIPQAGDVLLSDDAAVTRLAGAQR